MNPFPTFNIVPNPTAALKCDYCQQTLTEKTRVDIGKLSRPIPAMPGIHDGKPEGSPAVMCFGCCYMERC